MYRREDADIRSRVLATLEVRIPLHEAEMARLTVTEHLDAWSAYHLGLQHMYRFNRGDIEIADEEMEHTPVALAGQDCICLAATDAPLRFRGLLPRLAQPLLRI